jgi:ribosomal protein L9
MDAIQEIKDLLKEFAIDQKALQASQIENTAKFKELHRQLSDIGLSNGEAAESFFYNSLEDNKMLGNVKFDEIAKNIKQKRHRTEDEYDIFLENGNSVGIIEVKYKVTKDHINKMVDKKANNFRILFPDYSDYKLYIGIAGLSFEPNVEKLASDNGLVVLKQKGEIMQVNSSHMRAF